MSDRKGVLYPAVYTQLGKPVRVMLFADDRSQHHFCRTNPGWVKVQPCRDAAHTYTRYDGQWMLDMVASA